MSTFAPKAGTALNVGSTITLNNGLQIPRLGLGSWTMNGQECLQAIKNGFKVGYRHIDTAKYYLNEGEIGQAFRESGLRREEVFLTTKLRSPSHCDKQTRSSVEDSLREAKLEYWDLVLIHNPQGGQNVRKNTWHELEKLVKEGMVKSIGVSNFGVGHLKEVLSYATIKPVVNQIELHPFFVAKDVVEYCNQHDIAVQAYCPLARVHNHDDKTLKAVAASHKASVAQILIAWSLRKGFVPLPKSSNPSRQQQNADAATIELSQQQMNDIDALNQDIDGSIEMESMALRE